MFGRIILMLLGYVLLGPVGLLLGFWLGGKLDHRLNRYKRLFHFNLQSTGTHLNEAQKTFFDTTFQVMGHIAKSDGRVSEHEIHIAESIMKELGLNDTFKHQAMRSFNEGKLPHFHLDSALKKLNRDGQYDQQLFLIFLELQQRMARADGYITAHKKRLLQSIARQLNIEYGGFFHHRFDHFYQQQKQHYHRQQQAYQEGTHTSPAALQEAYRLFGVSSSVNEVQLKRAYRQLISKHHPDKLMAKGLPEEMIRLATQKTQQIRKAYQLICKAKGFKH